MNQNNHYSSGEAVPASMTCVPPYRADAHQYINKQLATAAAAAAQQPTEDNEDRPDPTAPPPQAAPRSRSPSPAPAPASAPVSLPAPPPPQPQPAEPKPAAAPVNPLSIPPPPRREAVPPPQVSAAVPAEKTATKAKKEMYAAPSSAATTTAVAPPPRPSLSSQQQSSPTPSPPSPPSSTTATTAAVAVAAAPPPPVRAAPAPITAPLYDPRIPELRVILARGRLSGVRDFDPEATPTDIYNAFCPAGDAYASDVAVGANAAAATAAASTNTQNGAATANNGPMRTAPSGDASQGGPQQPVVATRGRLPPGWERRVMHNATFYLDHISREAHEQEPWVVWWGRAGHADAENAQ